MSSNLKHLIWIIALTGCSEQTNPMWDTNACNQFIVPHAFGIRWENLNHRISEWKIRPSHEGCRASDLFVRSVGGDFSTGDAFGQTDDPSLTFGYQAVETDREEVGIARVSLNGTIDPSGTWKARKTFRRSALNLRHYPTITAVLDGVTFDTAVGQPQGYPEAYNPAHGYTVSGFGASARILDVNSIDFTLEVSTTYDAALSNDRPNMNDALPYANIDTSIDVLLVATSPEVPVISHEHSYDISHPKPKPLEDLEIPDPSIDAQRVAFDGDLSEGFRGIASFDYRFNFVAECTQDSDCFLTRECLPTNICRTDSAYGDYLRELRVELNVEPDSDVMLFNGYASNSSSFLTFFALRYNFVGEAVWFGADVSSSEQSLSNEFKTGSFSVALP